MKKNTWSKRQTVYCIKYWWSIFKNKNKNWKIKLDQQLLILFFFYNITFIKFIANIYVKLQQFQKNINKIGAFIPIRWASYKIILINTRNFKGMERSLNDNKKNYISHSTNIIFKINIVLLNFTMIKCQLKI